MTDKNLHFLEHLAVASSTTLPMLLSTILPLTTAVLGKNVGTRLAPTMLTPVNINIITVSAFWVEKPIPIKMLSCLHCRV